TTGRLCYTIIQPFAVKSSVAQRGPERWHRATVQWDFWKATTSSMSEHPDSPVTPSVFASPWAVDGIAAQIRPVIQGDLAIESIRIPQDPRRDGALVVHGRLLRPSQDVFAEWVAKLRPLGYTPLLRRDGEEDPQRVVLHVMACRS